MSLLVSFFLCLISSTSQAAEQACGTEGEIRVRIADCANTFPELCIGTMAELVKARSGCATAVIKSDGNSFTWKLVSRTPDSKQVWRDEKTGLVWSARFERPLPWTAAEKVCALARNGNMAFTANLAIGFRLPNDVDFRTADAHGIAAVLPGVAHQNYWTANSDTKGYHVAIFSRDGYRYVYGRTEKVKSGYALRCISSSTVDPIIGEGTFKGLGPSGTGGSPTGASRSSRQSID